MDADVRGGLLILAVLGVILIGAFFAGCQGPACPGFERVKTGSLCRDVTTGLYVPLVKCDECDRS